jgi:hypothetical protein
MTREFRSEAHRRLWKIVDGAVRDAFEQHPDYLTEKGKRNARASVTKRVVGTVLGFAGEAAGGRSDERSAAENDAPIAMMGASRPGAEHPGRPSLPVFWIFFAMFIVGVLLGATQALSHGWYDPYCCNDQDCAPIAPQHVAATEGGWLVTLGPGDHPMVKEPRTFLVPYADARPSGDDAFHACIVLWRPGEMRCFYAPPMGF